MTIHVDGVEIALDLSYDIVFKLSQVRATAAWGAVSPPPMTMVRAWGEIWSVCMPGPSEASSVSPCLARAGSTESHGANETPSNTVETGRDATSAGGAFACSGFCHGCPADLAVRRMVERRPHNSHRITDRIRADPGRVGYREAAGARTRNATRQLWRRRSRCPP